MMFLDELVSCWLLVVMCWWGTQNTCQLFLCSFLERLCMLLQTQCFFNACNRTSNDEHIVMMLLAVVSICVDGVRLIADIVGCVDLIVSR